MEKRKREGKRLLAGMLALALIVGIISPAQTVQAAKNVVSVEKTMELVEGQAKTLKAKGSYIKKKIYKSSNKKIAIVNKKGKVTAKKAGKCKITVTVKYKKTKQAKKLTTKKTDLQGYCSFRKCRETNRGSDNNCTDTAGRFGRSNDCGSAGSTGTAD